MTVNFGDFVKMGEGSTAKSGGKVPGTAASVSRYKGAGLSPVFGVTLYPALLKKVGWVRGDMIDVYVSKDESQVLLERVPAGRYLLSNGKPDTGKVCPLGVRFTHGGDLVSGMTYVHQDDASQEGNRLLLKIKK